MGQARQNDRGLCASGSSRCFRRTGPARSIARNHTRSLQSRPRTSPRWLHMHAQRVSATLTEAERGGQGQTGDVQILRSGNHAAAATGLGRPIVLQKAWTRKQGRTEPVRMNRKAEYHPNTVV